MRIREVIKLFDSEPSTQLVDPAVVLGSPFGKARVEVQAIEQALRAQGFTKEIISKIKKALPRGSSSVDRALAIGLNSLVKCNSSLGLDPSQTTIVLMIGPRGVGKTAVAARLGLKLAHAWQLRVSFLELVDEFTNEDPTLSKLASQVGFPSLLCDRAALGQGLVPNALSAFRGSDVIIIDVDSTGLKTREIAQAQAILTEEFPSAERLLVLKAGETSVGEARGYAALNPSRVVLTGLDSSAYIGELVSTVIEEDLPIGFISLGKDLRSSLEPATNRRLALTMLRQIH